MIASSRNLWILLAVFVASANCGVARETKSVKLIENVSKAGDAAIDQESRQLFLGAEGKETSTPNFVRLVVMRLIYGLASSMGVEERLESAFNGVLVPPNADGGLFNFGGLGGGGGGDGDDGDELLGGGDELLGGLGGLGDLFDY